MDITRDTFRYLDLEFSWNADRELEFQIHRKENQKFKYLNKRSTHINATFNGILSGNINGLAKLTSRTKKSAQMRIDKKTKDIPRLYPKPA